MAQSKNQTPHLEKKIKLQPHLIRDRNIHFRHLRVETLLHQNACAASVRATAITTRNQDMTRAKVSWFHTGQ